MKRRISWLLITVAFVACTCVRTVVADEEKSEKRVALVIGVSSYQHAPRLANPVNDARAIGEALERLKFDVVEVDNPDYRALAMAIREFGIRASTADFAVVYYAGHGVQVERENYLLPVDAKLERPNDLFYEAMPLERLLAETAQAHKIGIVFLDSCRNNPFVERVSRSLDVAGRAIVTQPGMARVDNVPSKVMVMMAAKADQVAEDGGGAHSPFAAALLVHFQIPGLELGLFARSVHDTVLRVTHNRQEPYFFGSLSAEPVYFFPRPPNRPPAIGHVKTLELPEIAGPSPLGFPQPTDPDQDPLSVRIVGLPRSGEVRIEGRTVTINAVYPLDKFMTATYKPDGKSLGPVGTLDILVEDGRGGNVTASLPITILSSHHPAIVEAPREVRAYATALNIAIPNSPDGDPLSVVITALPRGTVQNGASVLKLNDRLHPQDLPKLTYLPEPGMSGDAGSLKYIVDNGHDMPVEGRIDIKVAMPETQSTQVAKAEPPKSAPAAIPVKLAPIPPPQATEPKPQEPQQIALVPPTPPRTAIVHPNSDEHVFRDCPTCPVMVRVPGGSFMMGFGAHEPESLPVHRVELRSFAIGQAPVTVAEWKACVAAKACNFMPRMRVATDRTPIHNLSWDDTAQYINWLSQITGHQYRLPSEAEWEYAARGGTTTRYWWGDGIEVAEANCRDCGGKQTPYGPMPVDAFKPNPYGLLDMLGGVAQWTGDCWVPNYVGAPTNGEPREAKYCEKRVLRGGGFREGKVQIAVMARGNYDASVRYLQNGFRVARD